MYNFGYKLEKWKKLCVPQYKANVQSTYLGFITLNDLLFFPGSQEYVAAGRIPFMWAQSLYVISQLLKDSFIACGELDPINRRLSSLQRPEVIVQVVVLAKDEKIKDLLNQVKQLNK